MPVRSKIAWPASRVMRSIAYSAGSLIGTSTRGFTVGGGGGVALAQAARQSSQARIALRRAAQLGELGAFVCRRLQRIGRIAVEDRVIVALRLAAGGEQRHDTGGIEHIDGRQQRRL